MLEGEIGAGWQGCFGANIEYKLSGTVEALRRR